MHLNSEAAPGHPGVTRIVAPNPGPMTLGGTNTYVVGEEPAWVIDPGPADPAHIEAVRVEGARRGGIAGVLLTHGHLDHSEGVEALGAELVHGTVGEGDEGGGFALAAASLDEPVEPAPRTDAGSESTVGPFTAVPTPGHAPDHVAFAWGSERGPVVFCGDLVLGEGSSIVPPAAAGGSLAAYMSSLDRLERLDADLLAPGHGPWIADPRARIGEYREHRRRREHDLLAALERGERSRGALLAAAWADVPEPMRPVAALAMQAHLEKLAADGIAVDGLHP